MYSAKNSTINFYRLVLNYKERKKEKEQKKTSMKKFIHFTFDLKNNVVRRRIVKFAKTLFPPSRKWQTRSPNNIDW